MHTLFFLSLALGMVMVTGGCKFSSPGDTSPAGVMSSASTLTLHPGPPGVDPSPLYAVKVNGKPAFVHACSVPNTSDPAGNLKPDRHTIHERAPAALCTFDFTGKVTVEVTILDLKTHHFPPFVTVRPLRHGIVPVIDGNTFRFEIDRPCQLSIEPIGIVTSPLFLFANPPEDAPPPDPKTPGVKYFGPGVHVLGNVKNLDSNTTLYLAGGAIVRGQLNVENASNITIRGRGIFDSSLSPSGNEPANEYGHPGRQMRFFKCRNVTIDGVILHDSPSWGIELAHCQDVSVRNIKVLTSRGADGIDVCSSQRVRVRDSFFRTNDDSLNIKGLTDLAYGYPATADGKYSPDGNRAPVRDVSFLNCVIWNDRAHGIMVGPETRATVIEDILFQDIDFIHTFSVNVIGIFSADAAPIRRVRFERIRVEDPRVMTLFEIRVGPAYTTADPECGSVEDITIRDMHVIAPTRVCSAICGDRNAVRNVRLENIHIYDKFARTLQDLPVFVRGQTSDVTLTVDGHATPPGGGGTGHR